MVSVRRLGTRLLLLMALVGVAQPAPAASRLHALIIGNNEVPAERGGRDGPSALVPLRYADDDAAALAAFIGPVAASLHLLTLMDARTQALYPELVSRAKPPTLAAVDEAVTLLAQEVTRDLARGDESIVWLFFSGHGSTSNPEGPELLLSDGGMTRELLYDRVLARLPATSVHLLIDACYAESVVRPRDSYAELVELPPAVTEPALLRATLARYPHVGAVVASSRSARAHEWDALGHGVFTHELLSALRGGADVNGDGRIEYSEVSAFISAANRSVSDPRARLEAIAHPPRRNRSAPLLSLSDFPPSRMTRLTNISGKRGMIQITDASGRRLATVHNAADLSVSLLLPSGSVLFVTADGVEAEMSARAGDVVRFSDLRFEPKRSRPRGALAHALERGLFATAYGRGYYEGFTANAPGLLSVSFQHGAAREDSPSLPTPSTQRSAGPSFRLGVGLGGSGTVARELGTSYGVQLALRRSDGAGPGIALDVVTVREGALRESRAAGKLGWFWQTAPASFQAYGGPLVGVGWILQQIDGSSARSSALALSGFSLGALTRLTDWLGVFAEVEGAAELMRRDSHTEVSFRPSAWLGSTFEW